jgi:hypothetical protein
MMVLRVMKYLFILMLTATTASCNSQDTAFTAERLQRSASIVLEAPIARVFPLFGIIREKEWSPGWSPTPIFPLSGEMAEGSVYRTPGHVHGEPPLTWVVSRFDTASAHLTYLVTAADRIVSIDIQCAQLTGGWTRATITYSLTGLTVEGNAICHHLLGKLFAHGLQDWQAPINELLMGKKPG